MSLDDVDLEVRLLDSIEAARAQRRNAGKKPTMDFATEAQAAMQEFD